MIEGTADATSGTASRDRAPLWMLFAVLAVPVVLGVAIYLLATVPLARDLHLCDEAIKAQLKAPTTYKRVKAPDTYSNSTTFYSIEYDAANGFGVPLRGKGSCQVNGARTSATWVEYNF